MKMHFDLIRTWKDQIFRQHLSEKQTPTHPGGKIELSDPQLTEVCGGFSCSDGGNGGNSDLGNGGDSNLGNDGDLGSSLGNFGSGLGNFGS